MQFAQGSSRCCNRSIISGYIRVDEIRGWPERSHSSGADEAYCHHQESGLPW